VTSADPPNSSSRLRTAGMALLALAALSLVVGIVSLVGGGGPSGQTAQGSPSPTTTGQPSVPNQPPATAVPSQSQPVGTTTTTTTAKNGTTTNGKPPTTQTQHTPLRIYNNSTISGLAVRAADDLRNAGWNVGEVGNYPYGVIATTTVYFRPGTDEEGAANQVAASFQMRAEPRFEGIANAPPGVIVIVTNDYKGLQTK
jgi:hypothetical protein